MLLRRCVSKAEKTQKSHAVLGEGDWIGMRDCLLPMAWNFAVKTVLHDVRGAGSIPGEAPPRTVLTQVSLAIAALACKMPNWDERAVVRDLAGYFGVDAEAAPDAVVNTVVALGGGAGSNPGNAANNAEGHKKLSPEGAAAVTRAGAGCLLQILAVLPDEVTARRSPSTRAAAPPSPTGYARPRRRWCTPRSMHSRAGSGRAGTTFPGATTSTGGYCSRRLRRRGAVFTRRRTGRVRARVWKRRCDASAPRTARTTRSSWTPR